jgi:hypothetical protein
MSAEAPPPLAAAPVEEATGEAAPKGSLGFLRGGQDYYHDKPAASPADKSEPPASGQNPPAADQNQAAPPSAQAQAAAKATAKPGLKSFSMPKLKPTSDATDFRSRSGLGQGGGAQAGGAPPGTPAGAGMPDMGAMMKGMTGGAGGAGAPPGAAGMPDMGAMMKGMAGGTGGKPGAAPGAAPTGAAGSNLPAPLPGKKGAGQPAMPDVGGMLKGKGLDGQMGKLGDTKKNLPADMQGMVPDVGGMLKGIPGMSGDQNKK